MNKLKTLLQSNYFALALFIITGVYCFSILFLKINFSSYTSNSKKVTGIITSIKRTRDLNIIEVKNKENFLVYDIQMLNYQIGDRVVVIGNFSKPKRNSNFYLFNYQNYLKSKGIFWIVNSTKINFYSSKNILYNLKNLIINRIDSIHNPYLNAFILGDTSLIADEVLESYRGNGISHLFAISGLHVSLITIILIFIGNTLNLMRMNYIIIPFLFFYLFLVNYSISIMRSVFLYILILLNKKFDLKISTIKIILFLACLNLFINPYIIYNSAFIFTYVVTASLIFCNQFINQCSNYFIKLFKTSLISFLITIPVVANNYFQVNLLSIIFNLIFVPFLGLIIFPLSIIVFLIPQFNTLLVFLISILEFLSIKCLQINIGKITLCHINMMFIAIYYIIIIFVMIMLNYRKYKYAILIFIILIIHSNYRYFEINAKVSILDVGQGDSTLVTLHKNRLNILIDTGGNLKGDITKNILVPSLKARGIKQLNYLILTHGDFDHMGEAINLVNNFKVENVVFNCGEFNELEKELISVLDKKKIKYYRCINNLNINNNIKMYFLNDNDYGNENDNSIVIYTEINNYKFLLMGDASIKTEKDIISKYNLNNIDVIKIGHHGSRTSSSKEFIDKINPKYSVISVGKKNRYNHPNKEVLEVLDNSKIYRTDIDGSIVFKIKGNKLNVSTCPP